MLKRSSINHQKVTLSPKLLACAEPQKPLARSNGLSPFLERETSEHGVEAFVPMYEPLKVETCKKCKNIIAEPKELIRIVSEKDLAIIN